jgi:hypothetical protein
MLVAIQNNVTSTSSCISKVVTKVPVYEQKSDFAFWQTQPYEARLATLDR